AQDNLSVQVHPSDEYAQKFENQLGKHEMWYIIDAAPDSFIYLGLNRTVSKEEFAARIKDETLTEILQKIYVKPGDSFFIPAGTIHSIGKGILLAEVQQSSNVSYRIYDYGRVDAYGNKRDLHIDKALDVADLSALDFTVKKIPHLAACDYFTVDKISLDGKISARLEGTVTEKSFLSVLILNGRGIISAGDETLNYKKGDCFFLPADSGKWQIKGVADILLTYI
ncbi:MAG: class I mannose-6-phosphate isomerase, partial [Selenomonadaceae bacterium]|nr:class I mannose-6-phosphate isomerase [Selenomonadaceae bacterium]